MDFYFHRLTLLKNGLLLTAQLKRWWHSCKILLLYYQQIDTAANVSRTQDAVIVASDIGDSRYGSLIKCATGAKPGLFYTRETSDSQASIRLETTSRKTQSHVTQSH